MPTYDFRCSEGHTFDRFFRKIADAPFSLECPICGKVAERQVSGGAGLHFKGSGFYITDYARKGDKGEGGGDTGSKDSGSSGGEGAGGEAQKREEKKPADSAGSAAKGGSSSE